MKRVHYKENEMVEMLMVKAGLTHLEAQSIAHILTLFPLRMYKPLIKVLKTFSKGRKI